MNGETRGHRIDAAGPGTRDKTFIVIPIGRQRLSKIAASTTAWAVLALIVVVVGGALDPFGIRRRLDWIVQDQFLQHRPPAPLHPDLLQVSVDDYAAIRLGRDDRRHRLARAMRQLDRLGAKLVLVDMLFLDQGSPDSFYQEEAAQDGIPDDAMRANPALQNRYLEDRLLAESLSKLNQVVIPFHLLQHEHTEQSAEQTNISAMADLMRLDPHLSPKSLAAKLSLDDQSAMRIYEPACELAADEIAREPSLPAMVKLLEKDPVGLTAADLAEQLGIDITAASRLFNPAFEVAVSRIAARTPNRIDRGLHGASSPVFKLVARAFDERRVLDRLRAGGAFKISSQVSIQRTEEPHVPLDEFAENATLGFADFTPDADGTFREIQLLANWDGLGLVHQSLAAVALDSGLKPSELRMEQGVIHVGLQKTIPVDRQGEMTINWPMTGQLDPQTSRRDWEVVVPQISVADLLDLANYDADLQRMRYNLRINIVLLDNDETLALGFQAEEKCDVLLNEIIVSYINEDFAAARRAEKVFDEERIPLVLKHPSVQKLLSQAKADKSENIDGTTQSQIAAQNILKLQEEIPRTEAALNDALLSLRERVQGKLCLVGDTTTAGTDLKTASIGSDVPGVTINLAAINTMLTGRYLSTPGIVWAGLLTIVCAGGLSWVFQQTSAVWSFGVLAVGILVLFFGHYLALTTADMLASPVLPMTGTLACFLVITTRRWWFDAREKQKVREAFKYYLHPAMVDKLTRDPELVRLGGEDKDLTILFADIRGFSGISEKLSAEELQKYLNGFFTPMSRIAQDHGGTIDKYIGDEMMVFYGAPLSVPDHPLQAVLTALEMIERLKTLQVEWREQGLPDIRIGVGVNTDVVRVGNFGSDDKFDYTVIGDGVNLSSRLQGATKQYGVQILVSENTWKRVGNQVVGREIDRIQVVGRLELTKIFNPVGRHPLDERTQEFVDRFQDGITAFQDRQWDEAIAHFHEAKELNSEDRPTTLYIERCEQFMKSPPPADWSGVTSLDTK